MQSHARLDKMESNKGFPPCRESYLPNSCASLIVALTIVFSSWTNDAVADQPKNADYAALKDAIIEGKEPRMLIDFSACQVHGAGLVKRVAER